MQSEKQKTSASQPTESAKKDYRKPQVVIYGSVGDLTKNVGSQGNEDNGTAPKKKTR